MSERFLSQLGEEVARTARRVDRKRRNAKLAAVSAIIVLATVGVGLVGGSQQASATVDVSIVDGEFIVRLVDFESMPSEVEAAAAAEGLNLKVTEVPVGPSNVGKFVGYETLGESPPEIRSIGSGFGETSFEGFALPTDYSGTLEVLMGRPSSKGEEWHTSSDALSKGEVLACKPLLGHPLRRTLDELADQRVGEVRVLSIDEGRYLTDDEWERWGDTGVRRVLSSSPSAVTVVISRSPGSLPPQPPPFGC